jgi:metal-sulfur cluster biosynthetic enzyme
MNVVTNHTTNCSKALAGLKEVLDPEVGLNVVDLGLIYQLNFEEEAKKILALMTLTTQFCPMGGAIVDGVTNSLESGFPDYNVLVSVTFDPPWNQEMISKEGIDFLNR